MSTALKIEDCQPGTKVWVWSECDLETGEVGGSSVRGWVDHVAVDAKGNRHGVVVNGDHFQDLFPIENLTLRTEPDAII